MSTVVAEYDAKLDSKKRFTVRRARTEFYHVKEFADGSMVWEPRVLVSPDMLRQIEAGAERYKAGDKGQPLDWSQLPQV